MITKSVAKFTMIVLLLLTVGWHPSVPFFVETALAQGEVEWEIVSEPFPYPRYESPFRGNDVRPVIVRDLCAGRNRLCRHWAEQHKTLT